MTADEIPPELKAILDRAAGRVHSQNGKVMTALAEILTEYDKIVEKRTSKNGQNHLKTDTK